MANVTVIPATRNFHTGIRKDAVVQKKTAGYARVSTDSEEQQTSYEAQVDYYTNYIKGRDDWEFVEVYTDDGITGTTVNRPAFQRTMQMILCGEVNSLIVTELSRLSRNQSFANNLIEVTLPSFKVRLFSLSATNTPADENLAMFFNLFNEYFPRMTSQKINTVIQMKAEVGTRIASIPPYGYQKDPEDKYKFPTAYFLFKQGISLSFP